MNQHLGIILTFIQHSKELSDELKNNLLKAVQKAESELEHKDHELEIEASLERVRVVAMNMKKPDDMLGVCQIISEQLELLGIKEIRNVQTAIFYESKGTYINYEYYRLHDKSLITEVDYLNNEFISTFASKMMKGPGEFFTESFKEKALKTWIEYQKTTSQFADTYLNTATTLNYYWFSLGPIALGISTYHPLNEEGTNLFKRFLKVFELSYRRYLDIEKAEAQAREARIEASLEHMRAAAMSMRKPEDVIFVCEAMFRQLTLLGFKNIRNAQTAIKNDKSQSYLISTYSDYEAIVLKEAPYKSSPIVEELYNELGKSSDAFFQKQFSGEKIDEWRKWRNSLSELKDIREVTATSMCFYLFSIGEGHLGISTFDPITDEQVEILKRFKNVFELSYQRFTDVAK